MRQPDITLFDGFCDLISSGCYELSHLMSYRDIAQTMLDSSVNGDWEALIAYSHTIENIQDCDETPEEKKEELIGALMNTFETLYVESDQ